jgi:hypothetical protein
MVTYLNDINSLSVYNGTAFTTDRTIQVFAGTAARGSAIGTAVEGMYTHINDTDSLEYYNGSSWVAAGGGGAILQVVSNTITDKFTSGSDTFDVVTGLSASITPSSATSKILIFAQIAVGMQAGVSTFGAFKVTRGGTDIYLGDSANDRVSAVFGGATNIDAQLALFSFPITYLDSPATTSSTTYQVETRRTGTSSTINVNSSANDGNENRAVRGASSITLMEVAG